MDTGGHIMCRATQMCQLMCHISRRLGIAGMCSCFKQAAANLGEQRWPAKL